MAATLADLSPEVRALLSDERQVLDEVRSALERLHVNADDRAALAQSIRQLDDLFLLVVIGEFNAGKSAFINALTGTDALAEGVTPTTARVTVVSHGAPPSPGVTADGLDHVHVQAPRLRDLRIVDTPGTNAVLREHEALTTHFVPRADLVLFVTSADRPFTESERALLEGVRDWGKKILVVVNKADLLETGAQVREVVDFVAAGMGRLLGLTPAVLPVSARLARRARGGEDAAAWEASGFAALERHLSGVLEEAERLRLKLANPVGVARRLLADVATEVDGRLALLADDRETVEALERDLGEYSRDMRRDFAFRWSDIDKLLIEMEHRGHDHIDDTLRIGRVFHLIDARAVQDGFAQAVVGDTPSRIERKVHELIDWLVGAQLRLWQQTHERLGERLSAHRARLGPASSVLPGDFHAQRSRLAEGLGRDVQRVIEGYDRTGEARALAERARAAVATSAALEAGAAGLGAVVATVATTAAADITGLAMAGVVATLGLLVIPARRRQAKRELRDKVTQMREQIGVSLRGAFDDELQRGIDRHREGLAPYTRFVRAESGHLTAVREDLAGLAARLAAIEGRIAGVLSR